MNLQPFKKHFNPQAFWRTLRQKAGRIGSKGVYSGLLLYYAYHRRETPFWAKSIVLGALGYLIAPIDALPDLTPVLGYTDDLGVLSFALVTIAGYINDEVKQKARNRFEKWFGEQSTEVTREVDENL